MKHSKLTNDEYREINAISNGELQQIETNPADYIWNKNAPQDPTKALAFDFGTALHTALLEPELFNSQVVIYDQTKSRDTVKFQKFMETQTKCSLVLLESEYDKIRFMVDSAKAHPTFSDYLKSCPQRESSIVVDNFHGVAVKIRPDLHNDDLAWIGDLKSTADLSDWRDTARWKNPLFKFNYGFTAAFYMDVYQEYLGNPVDEYTFLVCQKTVSGGKHPVAVFTITRDELEMYGFFERVYSALETYKECKAENNWSDMERFPVFPGFDDVSVSFEE